MLSRSTLTRAVLWMAVLALILRAGVPLLAAGAAQLRGVAVADVCEVYGVALPDPAEQQHAEHHHHHADHARHDGHSKNAHGDDHCALTALGALAASYADARWDSQTQAGTSDLSGPCERTIHDACAMWAARLKHGPPAKA